MKKFKSLSEIDILQAAFLHYLELWSNQCTRLEKNPDDVISLHYKSVYQKITDELRDEIIRIQNK